MPTENNDYNEPVFATIATNTRENEGKSSTPLSPLLTPTPQNNEPIGEAHQVDQRAYDNPRHGDFDKADENDDDHEEAESVESDYYYDDEGKMHTYYKPKRHNSALKAYLKGTHKRGETASTRHLDLEDGAGSDARHSVSGRASRTGSNRRDADDTEMKAVEGRAHDAPHDVATSTTENDDTKSVGSHGTSLTNNNSFVGQLPPNLHSIGKQIHKLTTEELLYISAVVGRKAHKEAYSVLQYSGSAWYLPNIRAVRAGEREWELSFSLSTGCVITIAGRRMEVHVLGYVLRAALLVAFWFAVWNALPKHLSERGGYLFDPVVTLLVCSIVGGFICRLLQIPPLVGCIWIGLMWNNIPEVGYLTTGIYKDVRVISNRMGITVVLLRAGFSMSWKTVRPILPNVASLVVGAFGVESMVHGFFANYMFEYDSYKWSFLQGCLCSAPSAAVVVPGALMLQAEGYSKTKGPLPVMLAAVGVETVISVWVVSFIIDLMFGSMSPGLSAALGPIQLIVGCLVGILLGFIFHFIVVLFRSEATRLPTGKFAETHLASVHRNALIFFLVIAHAVTFFANYQNLAGGGAVTVMVFACTVSNYWMTHADHEWQDMKKELGAGLSDVWDLFVMPFLFSMTGSKVVVKKIFNSTFFPKALACWVVSNAARMLAISFTPFGLGFSWKERLYMMGGYLAKATVQSALSSAALDKVNKKISSQGLTPQLLKDRENALNVQNMAIFYVLFSAPLAATLVRKLGPRVLVKED